MRLLDNPALLLEGVSLPGPRASAQSIRGNRLCAGVHLGCGLTPKGWTVLFHAHQLSSPQRSLTPEGREKLRRTCTRQGLTLLTLI